MAVKTITRAQYDRAREMEYAGTSRTLEPATRAAFAKGAPDWDGTYWALDPGPVLVPVNVTNGEAADREEHKHAAVAPSEALPPSHVRGWGEYGGWVTLPPRQRGACSCGVEVQRLNNADPGSLWFPTLPTAEDLAAFAAVVDLDAIGYDGTVYGWQYNADEYHNDCIRTAAGIFPTVGDPTKDVRVALAYMAWLRGIDLSKGDPCSTVFPIPYKEEENVWRFAYEYPGEDFPEDGRKPRSCGACLKSLPEDE